MGHVPGAHRPNAPVLERVREQDLVVATGLAIEDDAGRAAGPVDRAIPVHGDVGGLGLDAAGICRSAPFERQLQLAVDTDLPVVIHTREADDDTRDILANFSGQLARGGVILVLRPGRFWPSAPRGPGWHRQWRSSGTRRSCTPA